MKSQRQYQSTVLNSEHKNALELSNITRVNEQTRHAFDASMGTGTGVNPGLPLGTSTITRKIRLSIAWITETERRESCVEISGVVVSIPEDLPSVTAIYNI